MLLSPVAVAFLNTRIFSYLQMDPTHTRTFHLMLRRHLAVLTGHSSAIFLVCRPQTCATLQPWPVKNVTLCTENKRRQKLLC